MSIRFHCTACDADFEFEISRIVERPTAIRCMSCNAKPQPHRAEALGTALEDLLSAMSGLRSKLQFTVSLDTEKLPPPYGPAESAGAGLIEDDDDLAADDDDDLEDADDEDSDDEDSDDEDSDDEDSDDEDSDDEESDDEESDDETSGGDDDDDAADDDDDADDDADDDDGD